MAVSREDVFNACSEIYVSGKPVTVAAVREMTGGSFTTLSPLVKEWKMQQSGAGELSGHASEAVPSRFSELTAGLWNAALSLANERLESERRALDELRAELSAERAELLSSCDEFASLVDTLKFDRSEKSALILKLQEENAGLMDEVKRLISEHSELSAQLRGVYSVLADIKESVSGPGSENKTDSENSAVKVIRKSRKSGSRTVVNSDSSSVVM